MVTTSITFIICFFFIAVTSSQISTTSAESQEKITYEEGYINLYDDPSNNPKSKDSTPPVSSQRRQNDIVLALNLPLSVTGEINHRPEKYSAAAALAIHKINSDKTLLDGYRLRYTWHNQHTNTNCSEKKAINIMLRQLNMNVSGFLGFNCHCRTVSKISSAVNLPLFSSVSIISIHLFCALY